jgi:hypothetical protein
MTTERLAEIEKLLSSVITFKPLVGTSRIGRVGTTVVNLCEDTSHFLKKTEQACIQVTCGEMLTVYKSCKVEIGENSITFSNNGQRTVIWGVKK